MDPQTQQQYGHELPPARSSINMMSPNSAPETQSLPSLPETSQLPATPPTTTITATPPPITLPPAHTIAAQPTVHSATPAVANDLDLIEKEWVDKAKAIVASTRTDPHAQNDQMNHFKADYMKKRYGKDIKIET